MILKNSTEKSTIDFYQIIFLVEYPA